MTRVKFPAGAVKWSLLLATASLLALGPSHWLPEALWPLTSTQYRGLECMELYRHFPIRLRGVVVDLQGTRLHGVVLS